MTSAQTRRVFGRSVSYGESDFILEIPKDLREQVTLTGKNIGQVNKSSNNNRRESGRNYNNFQGMNRDIPPRNSKLDLKVRSYESVLDYSVVPKKEIKTLSETEATIGRKVKHVKFGVGTIITVNKKDGSVNLTIAFENMGIKNLKLDLAPLEII